MYDCDVMQGLLSWPLLDYLNYSCMAGVSHLMQGLLSASAFAELPKVMSV